MQKGTLTNRQAREFTNNIVEASKDKYNISLQIYSALFDMFEWEGLPDGLSSRRLEKWLCNRTVVGAFYSNEIGFTIQPVASEFDINCYEEPTTIRPVVVGNQYLTFGVPKDVTVNGLNATYSARRICWDNVLHTSVMPTIDTLINQLTLTLRAIENTITYMAVHGILKGTQTQINTLEKILSNMEERKLATLVSDKLQINEVFEFIGLNIPDKRLEDLWSAYFKQRGMLFEILGVPYNANSGKKERQITGEIAIEFSATYLLSDSRLREREEFCKRVNEAYYDCGALYNGELKVTQRMSKTNAMLEANVPVFERILSNASANDLISASQNYYDFEKLDKEGFDIGNALSSVGKASGTTSVPNGDNKGKGRLETTKRST